MWRIAVVEARGQFGNPEEGERLPFEAVTEELAETELIGKTNCVM
jgi:hypothetical protein